MRKSSLFHHKTIKKLREQTGLTPKQKEASGKWLSYLDAGDLEKEKESYPKFMKTILQDILGFPMKDIGHEVDNVDFSFNNPAGKKVLCVECKGTGTEPDALQHRDKKAQETPITQTWDYVSNTGSAYGICTNYKEFVLMTRNDYPALHWFDFESIRENREEKLKEFVGIFSKESLIDNDGFVEVLHKESVEAEREFTTEFYKLFHQTRLMMIQAFQEKEGVTKDEAINYTQLYLNRLIFIFFAEDNKFLEQKLFMERVKKSLNSNIFESSKSVSDQILDLFRIMDEGSDRLGIVGFGGELFQERIPSKIHFLDLRDKKSFSDITGKIKSKIKPDNTIQSLIDRERKLNPIIKNLLMMDSFDFTTDLNVNILGHIFEQSISDLEELKEEKVSRRKTEGVYYTPEYITDYICRNTIIAYLSKSGANSVHELILEYEDGIEELEKKFREIKIIDPACGSGAFLIKAVDILLEIHKEILRLKIFRYPEKYSDNGQTKMDKWNEESEAKKIIESNIYGVDVNPESVAVTKLALYLKIAERGKKLSGLTNNIKVGNSLISDKSIDEMAFDWEEQFPEKFDVVIGNPPYVQLSMDNKVRQNVKEYLIKRFESSMGRLNTFGFFTRFGIDILKNDGLFGFIIPNTILTQDYYEKLREMILDSCKIESIVSFSDLPFKDAVVENIILILRKTDSKEERMKNDVKVFNVNDTLSFVIQNKITQKIFLESRKYVFGIFWDKNILLLKEKLETDSEMLCDFLDVNQAIALRHDRQKWVTTNKSAKNAKPLLIGGKNINRYSLDWDRSYLIYDLNGIHSSKDESIFLTKEKIIFRRVANRLIATLDTEQFYGLHTLVIMNLKSKVNYNLRYFLAIFNSKLMTYYYQKIFASTKTVFSEIGARQVDLLPIKIPDHKIEKRMILLVDKMLSFHKCLDEVDNEKTNERIKIEEKISITDNEIDELVYKLYGITEDERKVIEEENT